MRVEGDEYIGQSWWYPRRPLVALPDLVVAVATLWLLIQSQWGFYTALYLVVASAQFFVSGVHHWLPRAVWHHTLDRIAIHWMIVITPLFFWNGMPEGIWFVWQMLALGFATVGTLGLCVGRLLHKGFWPSLFYAAPFLFGVLSLTGVELPSSQGSLLLWLGVELYLLQGIIYNFSWPNVRWHRVVQHLVLYAAFACHLAAGL